MILYEFGACAGAKAAGGGKNTMASAIIGAIIGAILGTILIPIPILGTLLGASIGAGIMVLIAERKAGKELKQSLKTATGAGLGQIFGTGAKCLIGLAIWLLFTITAFF
ncbi:MAG: hypothetical protein CVV39_08770 [Planctomycetes bacterium HGW-Planctomycetes-1]|nr:MAG: hypothetical protein CVV39_08770 [Planctomycetes bacterium HGW-Planctomycetes-1]